MSSLSVQNKYSCTWPFDLFVPLTMIIFILLVEMSWESTNSACIPVPRYIAKTMSVLCINYIHSVHILILKPPWVNPPFPNLQSSLICFSSLSSLLLLKQFTFKPSSMLLHNQLWVVCFIIKYLQSLLKQLSPVSKQQ